MSELVYSKIRKAERAVLVVALQIAIEALNSFEKSKSSRIQAKAKQKVKEIEQLFLDLG